MTPMIVRGVPRSLQRDAWWIAADSQTGVGSGGTIARRPWVICVLLIGLIDALALRTGLGLGFVAGIFSVGAAARWVLRNSVDRRRSAQAWGVLILGVIPAIDLVQATSFVMALVGLAVFAGILSGPQWARAAARIPLWGVAQNYRDLRAVELRGPSKSLVLDWLMPAGIGALFLLLLIAANPLVEGWITRINVDNAPSVQRMISWVAVGLLVWPLLRLRQMNLHKQVATTPRKPVSVAYLNQRSVLRALVVFNLIFAVQSVLDLGYLWGGVRLPDGMTYANYAHRGAYPLMMTALLAGGFALLAQPWLDGRVMRGLLLVWIGQTLVLVMSSILRLDLYVDSYGLTHLRFAAFVWMAVVALGLVVLIMQIVGRYSAGWMLRRAFGIGLVAVYASSVTNVAGYVARQQLTAGPTDIAYVCSLGEGAKPAVERYQPDLCVDRYYTPTIITPQDLRDWGFRNARLRRSLAQIKAEATK